MEILTPGHKYTLANFESGTNGAQTLQFIEREPIGPASSDMRTVNDGTTNEEVLEVLLDRLNYLNSKFPCRENAIAITHIETAILWLGRRTANRRARRVEGQHTA